MWSSRGESYLLEDPYRKSHDPNPTRQIYISYPGLLGLASGRVQ